MKIKKIIAVTAISVICAAGIGTAAVYGVKNSQKHFVTVVKMQELNNGYMGNYNYMSGMVTSDVSQSVFLTDQQSIAEVFVQEGDVVQEGDPLLSYDMTTVNMTLEQEKLNREKIQLQIQVTEKDLKNLKKNKPSVGGGSGGGVQIPVQPILPSEPEPSDTPTPEPTPSDTPTPTPSDTPTPEPTPSDTPTPTPSEAPEEEKPYDRLDFESEPFAGTGTKEDPYRFWCVDKTVVTGGFLNKMAGFRDEDATERESEGYSFQLEIHEEDLLTGEILRVWNEDGRNLLASDREFEVILQVEEPTPTAEPTPTDVAQVIRTSVTEGMVFAEADVIEQWKREIAEKERTIKNLKLDLKQSDLKIRQISGQLEQQQVTATISGVVKTVGDPKKPDPAAGPFLQVVSSEGLYVQSSVSELMLDSLTPGTKLKVNSWESGNVYEAEIKEISLYPEEQNMFGGGNNNNVSYYPMIAYVENGDGLRNMEYVELTPLEGSGESMEESRSISISQAFIREEGGKKYVYKDDDGKLKKQEITTGRTFWESCEILSGITMEDKLAFPYGKYVKEGARTKEGTYQELYQAK